jgi:hypothetical protein
MIETILAARNQQQVVASSRQFSGEHLA